MLFVCSFGKRLPFRKSYEEVSRKVSTKDEFVDPDTVWRK